ATRRRSVSRKTARRSASTEGLSREAPPAPGGRDRGRDDALLLGGFVGEVIEKARRGFAVQILPAATWIGGALLYLWRSFTLAFPRKGRAAA
ncbi:MAG: hypothetical protein ABR576_02170, partial [Thermoanaerobaculia bacterium]